MIVTPAVSKSSSFSINQASLAKIGEDFTERSIYRIEDDLNSERVSRSIFRIASQVFQRLS